MPPASPKGDRSAATGHLLPGAEVIASRDNPWLKRFRAALSKGEAAENGAIGVEGARLVEEAFRSGLEISALLVSPAGERHLTELAPQLRTGVAHGASLRLLRTSDRLFAGVADTQSPQGIAALVRPRAFQFDDLLRGSPLVVVLVGVQDPGNVGTVLRSAEAFGATGIVTTPGTANPLGPKALRASAGSAFRLPMITRRAAPVVLAQLRIAGLKLFAACPEGSQASAANPSQLPAETDLRPPAALLVGNEGAGLPPEVERAADVRIRIPLAATVDSLNAAVAASVLLYEAARQRGLVG